jgi:hypothetical protein
MDGGTMTAHYRRRLPRVRILNEIVDWQDWKRQDPALVRQVAMRRADNGHDVVVLRPTILCRLLMLWRQWRSVG